MKRICFFVLTLCLLLCSCTAPETNTPPETTAPQNEAKELLRGAWVTAFELKADAGCTAEEYERRFTDTFTRLKAQDISHVFVQVRPNCDALYNSAIFPASDKLSGKQGKKAAFDALQLLINAAQACDIKIHAWINPYRVSATSTDFMDLHESNPARIWHEARNNTNAMQVAGGIYLNPASTEVQKLIIDGVREIIDNYAVDGIHIDDYFYPETDETIDKAEYTAYKKDGGQLSLDEFRRQHVSALVGAIYRVVKAKSTGLLFTVSPCGDIDKNMNQLYADVKLWGRCDGYADYIIPQIYYGFENQSKPFVETVEKWRSICGEKLCVGLAAYKQGKEDSFAGTGRNEWLENGDVIERQIAYLNESGVGYCLFSVGYM